MNHKNTAKQLKNAVNAASQNNAVNLETEQATVIQLHTQSQSSECTPLNTEQSIHRIAAHQVAHPTLNQEPYSAIIMKNTKKKNFISQSIARFIAFLTRRTARVLTGARSRWIGCKPELKQRIYFANHTSHIDFILLWSSLPTAMRRQTRPVAASDYWLKDGLRRFLIEDTFNGVTIQRNRESAICDLQDNQQINPPITPIDPLQPIRDVLAEGYSIIFFPEGTRNLDDDTELLPFKSGLYHLAQAFPNVEIVPVWISNLKRVMPKGALIPLPLLSSVIFGTPLDRELLANKQTFLNEAQQALRALKEIENQ